MKTFSKFFTYAMLMAFYFTVSCGKKDATPDCGCAGNTFKHIENARAVYYGSGQFSIVEDAGNKTYLPNLIACKVDTTWHKTPDYKVPDYTVSGNIKAACFTGPTLVALPSPFEITSIRKD